MSIKISQKTIKTVCLATFVMYILIVLKLTIFRVGVFYDERQLNLSLFVDLIKVYKNAGMGEFLRLFFGNIGWFVPFGFLFPLLLKRESFGKVVALGTLFSFVIEMSMSSGYRSYELRFLFIGNFLFGNLVTRGLRRFGRTSLKNL